MDYTAFCAELTKWTTRLADWLQSLAEWAQKVASIFTTFATAAELQAAQLHSEARTLKGAIEDANRRLCDCIARISSSYGDGDGSSHEETSNAAPESLASMLAEFEKAAAAFNASTVQTSTSLLASEPVLVRCEDTVQSMIVRLETDIQKTRSCVSALRLPFE